MIAHRFRWMVLVGLFVTIVVGSAAVAPSSVTASTPLAIQPHNVETGGGGWTAEVYASGGTGGYIFSWTPVSNTSITYQNYGGNYSWAYGKCRVGYPWNVMVTVRDSSGATVSRELGMLRCLLNIP